MSSPFPTALTSAAKANRIAWVFDSRGERNVWVADAPDFAGRQVTHYQGDDGQDIFAVKLTPDGKTVVYARGSEVSSEGHVANPTTETKEPKQQVWAADVESGKPRLLGDMGCGEEDCEDIQLSPDGTDRGLGGAKESSVDRPMLLPTNPRTSSRNCAAKRASRSGRLTESIWRSGLAAKTMRSSRSLIWLSSTYATLRPALIVTWLRAGRPTASSWYSFASPGAENHLPLIPLRAEPWAIWLADAATAQAHELWHSGKEMNDSLPPFASESLKFAADGRIVFCSEQDGWNHLYVSLSTGGAPAADAGKFEVEDVELAPDNT